MGSSIPAPTPKVYPSQLTSFVFNTMIGQVTPIAMTNIAYYYYSVFIICNFTNALFFYLLLPETTRLPLEEMNYSFTNAPWIIPSTDKQAYNANYAKDLKMRAHEIDEKNAAVGQHEEVVEHAWGVLTEL